MRRGAVYIMSRGYKGAIRNDSTWTVEVGQQRPEFGVFFWFVFIEEGRIQMYIYTRDWDRSGSVWGSGVSVHFDCDGVFSQVGRVS
jgi:hypothetical protein